MAMFGKIRRLYYRDKLSEIARRTSLSRNTVKRWLRSPTATEPRYRRRPSEKKLTPHVEWLQRALETDAHRPRRDRRTALKLWRELRLQGFTGSYGRVTEYVRAWHAGTAEASASEGSTQQSDWCERLMKKMPAASIAAH